MCEIMEQIRAEGIEQGLERGREEAGLAHLRSVMGSLRVSAERALDLLGVHGAERERLAALAQDSGVLGA